jgi:hypothetical protein
VRHDEVTFVETVIDVGLQPGLQLHLDGAGMSLLGRGFGTQRVTCNAVAP